MFGGRPASALRDEKQLLTEKVDDLDGKFRSAISDLATESERAARAGDLQERLDQAREDRETLRAELAAMRADSAAHDRQIKQLLEAKEQLSSQFSDVGGKLLGEAQKAFLERADARFNQAEEKHEAKIKSLLTPVGDRLKAYEETVQKVEKERTEAYGNLHGLMQQMRDGAGSCDV